MTGMDRQWPDPELNVSNLVGCQQAPLIEYDVREQLALNALHLVLRDQPSVLETEGNKASLRVQAAQRQPRCVRVRDGT